MLIKFEFIYRVSKTIQGNLNENLSSGSLAVPRERKDRRKNMTDEANNQFV
jgi:hypothetical protein